MIMIMVMAEMINLHSAFSALSFFLMPVLNAAKRTVDRSS